MISVTIRRNNKGQIHSFSATGHGKTDACAAVSLFVINTANSIEALTDEDISGEYDPKGGYMYFELQDNISSEANILLEALALGLRSVKENYNQEIELTELK